MTYHVLHNPRAGQGHVDPRTRLSRLAAEGAQLRIYDITAITDYPALLASIPEEDGIIISGGDGTLNHFVNDVDGLHIPNELYYAPAGTGNDFLRDLNRSEDSGILPLRPYLQNLPVAELKGQRRRFFNNLGFGIDGYCSEEGEKCRQKNSNKPINYTAIAIKGLLFHYQPTTATVTVDGVTHVFPKTWVAPTMKGRCYGGGMFAAPHQDRLDPSGKLSVMIFHGKGRLRTLMAFPSIFKGEHIRHTSMVTILEGYDIRVSFDSPRTVQIDGEMVTNVTEYRACADTQLSANPVAAAVSEA